MPSAHTTSHDCCGTNEAHVACTALMHAYLLSPPSTPSQHSSGAGRPLKGPQHAHPPRIALVALSTAPKPTGVHVRISNKQIKCNH